MFGLMNPRLLIMAGCGMVAIIGSVWAVNAWNGYIDSIRAEVIQQCNTTQLEEELAFEKRKVQDLQERERLLQEIVDGFEPEIIERVEFRDRVITEIREVQSQVEETNEGRIREEISPTTRLFLDNLMDQDQ